MTVMYRVRKDQAIDKGEMRIDFDRGFAVLTMEEWRDIVGRGQTLIAQAVEGEKDFRVLGERSI